MSLSQSCEPLPCQGDLGLGVLLPYLAAVVVERAEVRGDVVWAWVRARADGAACPGCGTWSTRAHDGYERRLADAGIGGRRVVIWLRTRVLACGNGNCPAGGFAEQPTGLATPYARRTPLLAGDLAAVAVALAGRAGARLARVLAVEVSRHTLVRVLMALPEPACGPVRVLGVDDFSLRRGHTYATLLVDMESGVPADVLPDREAATLKTWLEAHPGVEVICRDRAGAYAEGARDGAPDADQVADRWHLWHNVCEHARKAVARHQDCIKDPARPCRHPQQQEKDREQEEERQEQEQEEECVPGPEDAIAARHRAVHGLRAAGRTLAETAAELGLSDQVTGRFWRAASASALLARRTPALDPWKPYLRQRWDQGATKITDLHREITARGFTGSYSITYAWLAMLRLAALPRPPAPPKPRLVTRWLLTDPARLDPAGAAALAAITAHCPDLAGLAGHVTEFAKILTGRHGSRLDAWLDAVTADPAQPDLHSFANGIRHDYQAVRNGLTLQWNSGRVEGLNTRTKLIKRQMYGRATFPLLRKRILLTS